MSDEKTLRIGHDTVDDLLNIANNHWKADIDPRFHLTRWVEIPSTGDFIAYLDYRPPKGQAATCPVHLTREQAAALTREQLIDFAHMDLRMANDDLVEFIDDNKEHRQ